MLKNMFSELQFNDIIQEMIYDKHIINEKQKKSPQYTKTVFNKSLFESRFLPVHISDYICENYDLFRFDFDDLCLTTSVEKGLLPKIDKILENVIIRIHLLKKYYNYQKKINVFLFRTPFKKVYMCTNLHKNHKIVLDVDNVNSGFSDTRSFIFREEEILKVLVHEILHQIDIGDPYLVLIKDDITFLINETFVEVNALILNILFVIVENKKYQNDLEQSFVNLMSTEMNFSLNQVGKILDIYGLNNKDEIDVVSVNRRSNASVSEYYIYKTAILFQINELVSFLKQDIFDNKFIELCERSLNKLHNIMKKRDIKKYCTNLDHSTSLKMTVVE